MLAGRLGEEHREERDQPLESLGTLVEFDLHAELVLDDDLEVLAIGDHAQPVGLWSIRIRAPYAADLVRQAHAGRVELVGAAVQLVPVALDGGRVVRGRLGDLAQIGELPGAEPEQLHQALVAVVVLVVVEHVRLEASRQMVEMDQRPDPRVVAEHDEDGDE